MVTRINAADWEESVSNSERPVVVDFWRPGCAWCRKLESIYDDLDSKFVTADFFKFDISDGLENMRLSQRFGIIGTPTIKIFCGGAETGELIGFAEKLTLRKDIKDVIENNKKCKKVYDQYSEVPGDMRKTG